MDEQGLDKVWLYPTLGMIYEQLLKHDPEGVGIMFRAFNRWLEEDWTYNFENRIFASPYISLADLDVAVEELERALSLGATHGLHAPGRAHHGLRSAHARRPLLRPVLGARQRGGHHRRRARGRQRLLAQRLRQGRVLGRVLRRRAARASA